MGGAEIEIKVDHWWMKLWMLDAKTKVVERKIGIQNGLRVNENKDKNKNET